MENARREKTISAPQKILIVEGNDDLAFVSNLMRNHVENWNPATNEYAVKIVLAGQDQGGGKNKITAAFVESRSKSNTHVGWVTDADENFANVQSKCKSILEAAKLGYPNVCLGYWIMPSNETVGMIEDLALKLVKKEDDELLRFAKQSSEEAKSKYGANFLHQSKATLRTFLAWQEEPGLRIGNAINSKLFDPHAEVLKEFINWFIEFYELKRI